MGISLSGGPYQYNRFDEFEEGYGASNPQKMKKTVDKAAVKSKSRGGGIAPGSKQPDEMKEGTQLDEIAPIIAAGAGAAAKGLAAKGAAAGAAKAGGGLAKAAGSKVGKAAINAGSQAVGNKVEKSLSSEDLNTQETEDTIMENPQMQIYARALGRMGAMYNPLTEGKKKKDDEPTAERKAAADRADEEKRQKKEGKKGEAHETKEVEELEDEDLKKGGKKKGKFWQDSDGDGKWYEKGDDVKEEIILTKEDVVQYLVDEGYASNEVSAEVLHQHISDDFLAEIEEKMISEVTEG